MEKLYSVNFLNSIRTQPKSNWNYNLEKSIEKYGITEPLKIGFWEEYNKIALLDGHNRLDTAIELGIEKIPAQIVYMYDNPFGKIKLYDNPFYTDGGKIEKNENYKLIIVIKNIKNPNDIISGGIKNKYKGAYKKIFDILNEDSIFVEMENEDEELIGNNFYLYFNLIPDAEKLEKISKISNVEIIRYENNTNVQFEKGGLIAPNGQPSNLNPIQYKLVRTKAFKDWFGDWENDPANASKVVDENGEPLVCSHYSQNPKFFNEFTKQKPNKTRNFYSLSIEGYYFSTANEESMSKVWNKSKKGVLYKVFLNVKNILDLGNKNAYDFKTKKAVDWKKFTFKMLEKYVTKGRQGSFDDYTEYDKNVDFFTIERIDETTKNKILKLGYDGIWGDKDKYADSISDQFYGTDQIVVFNSNQIKLADGTNTTFDFKNDDIRYNKGGYTSNSYDWLFW